MRTTIFFLLLVLLFPGCVQKKASEKDEVLVYCAASLTDVVSEIIADYELETKTTIRLNLASSGTLARQVENGAQADIIISANKKWIDYLDKIGKADAESVKRIAGNEMVLVAPLNSKLKAFEFSKDMDLPNLIDGRLSIGDPAHVPAGTYAMQILERLGCKKELEPRFLPAKDVRSALMVVELGEVEAGIVYKTDALKSGKVKILTEFPDSLHQAVDYYMALIKGTKNARSLQLYNYIVSEKSHPVWEKYGFKQ